MTTIAQTQSTIITHTGLGPSWPQRLAKAWVHLLHGRDKLDWDWAAAHQAVQTAAYNVGLEHCLTQGYPIGILENGTQKPYAEGAICYTQGTTMQRLSTPLMGVVEHVVVHRALPNHRKDDHAYWATCPNRVIGPTDLLSKVERGEWRWYICDRKTTLI